MITKQQLNNILYISKKLDISWSSQRDLIYSEFKWKFKCCMFKMLYIECTKYTGDVVTNRVYIARIPLIYRYQSYRFCTENWPIFLNAPYYPSAITIHVEQTELQTQVWWLIIVRPQSCSQLDIVRQTMLRVIAQ
jgi:hypothetical protein